MVHPKALVPLFLTEMWERYGFYIAQGMLLLFMTTSLNFADPKAYTILGAFTALVYIVPLLGGALADHVLGYRYAILTGALLLFIGYLLTATLHAQLSYVGLAAIVIGTGFLKPNISSYLGDFYTADDPRRDAGFTIFYMGINIGAILSMVSGGYIQRYLGWHAVFLAAAVGMSIAIATFVLGYSYFADYGLPLRNEEIRPQWLRRFANLPSLILVIVVTLFASYLLLEMATFANLLLGLIGIATLFYLLWEAWHFESLERHKMMFLILLILFSILFWALFLQLFFSINLFIDRTVDHMIFGANIPTIAFIAMESIFVIMLAPLFAWLWRHLQQRHRDIPIAMKFAGAMLFCALSMYVLALSTQYSSPVGLINPVWIALSVFILTFGELLISPIGLSMVTQFAPTQLRGLMMGVWFMGMGFGGALAGVLAQQANVPQNVLQISSVHAIYAHAFKNYAGLALAAALLILLLTPWLKKMQDEHGKSA